MDSTQIPGFLFIDHVAIAAPRGELEAQVAAYGLLGFREIYREDVLGGDQVREVLLQVGKGPNLIQLLEPLNDESPVQKLLERNGGKGGFAHVAFRVRDARAAYDHMAANGFRLIDAAPRLDRAARWCFSCILKRRSGTSWKLSRIPRMFIEFPPVTPEEWEAEAGKLASAGVMFGPGGEGPRTQPWRSADRWEILEEPPAGLFELPEAAPVMQLRAALSSGATSFLVPVDTQYFEEIAKFRALRRLFDEPIRIVAITGRLHQTMYDPHVNLLRATTCAMSAIIGGCDALVVRRFDEARGGDSGELASRLALNTQLLLREEAGFGTLTDPAAGSWFLEKMTQQLLDAVRSSADPGLVQRRKRELVGVTKQADPAESASEDVAVTEGRLATPYEKLRIAAEKSTRPRIRLILGKDAKMSRARADFARGVFQSGGFVVAEPADFGVLCAADSEYPAMIAAETELPLIVAGPETAGAFDFVNMKSDVPAKLQAWHQYLGIAEYRQP